MWITSAPQLFDISHAPSSPQCTKYTTPVALHPLQVSAWITRVLYKGGKAKGVQNVNARGTIYSIWIILHKCKGELRGTLGEAYRVDWVGVLVLNYSKTGGW